MLVNADFSQRVVLRTDELDWLPSPMPGVERRMLDRIGGEFARATSIVRYAPGSRFSAHRHDGGEEFLVLDGTFSDESGDYPAGSYVRNPIGSAHAPATRNGCTIFVKLHQFDPGDDDHVVVDIRTAPFVDGQAGVAALVLHEFGAERTDIVRLDEGASLPPRDLPLGAELLVLTGSLEDESGVHTANTWLRLPRGARLKASSRDGCLLYLKSGHLSEASLERFMP